jgi:CHC2 zinc finger
VSAAAKVFERLAGVKPTGPGRWIALCPAHEDRSPSFSIRETEDGRVLVHCFAGCPNGDVLAAIGLRMSDLFDKPISHHRAPLRKPFDAVSVLQAVAQEVTVVELIAWDMAGAGRSDTDQNERLTIASQRLNAALSMIGELPVPEEIKRIRRAEARIC